MVREDRKRRLEQQVIDADDYYQASRQTRNGELSFKQWLQIVGAIIVFAIVAVIIHFAWPVLGIMGPFIGYALAITVTGSIVATPFVLIWHLREERKIKTYLAHVFPVSPEGNYSAYHNETKGAFEQPKPGNMLPNVPQTLHIGGRITGIQEQQQEQPALPEPQVQIPQAPPFRMMSHLISERHMPLCYISDNGTSVPAFGTIDDLLSMAVTGKPGRGKTTALMYYVCMLLKCGAEVYVFDPHGAMNELTPLSNVLLPGMPRSARIVYVDTREDMLAMVPVLQSKLEERDELYRASKQTLHPLLLLADELPVLAEYDAQTAAEFKAINKARAKTGNVALDVPLIIDLIKDFVLEARKWRCFFIGSGQTFDADTLPTRVTENLNSRIVFFSSDKRARMSGLENETVKELLPIIRNAGPGVMVFDCARWEPMLGAIPAITMDDMMSFLGVQPGIPGPHVTAELLSSGQNDRDFPGKPMIRLVEPVPVVPERSREDESRNSPGTVPEQSRNARLTPEQSKMFAAECRKDLLTTGKADIKAILRRMKLGNAYYSPARIIAEHVKRESGNLRREG